jgi:methyl-accepting chemotaxis protein
MSDQTPTPVKNRFFSLRWKLLIGFTLLFSVVFAAAFYWFYTYATGEALGRIQKDLEDTIKGAAFGVNGDDLVAIAAEAAPLTDPIHASETLSDEEKLAQLSAILETYKGDPRMAKILTWLELVNKVEPRAYPYLGVPAAEEGMIYYVADYSMLHSPEAAALFMYKVAPNYTDSLKALQNEELVPRLVNGKFDIYTDEWGSWVSAYYSVKNSEGKIVGLIGVDFEASYVNQVREGILNTMIVVFIIGYVVLFLLVFFISTSISRPMLKLTHAARAIGEGNYETNLSALKNSRVKDEISTLADVFDIMVGKVYQREQNLRRQVEELKIEIDEVKRSKQLNEIVDTDFFRELQNKAKVMRNRARNAPAEETPGETPQE